LRTLGFDQSTQKTGYALFNGPDLVRWGILDKHKEKDGNKRVPIMIAEIIKVIGKIKPDRVVFEDVALQDSPRTLIMLSRIQGAIIGYCIEHEIPYELHMPTGWRKIVGFRQGKGIKREELKQQAIAFVEKCYGLRVGDDCAESICLTLADLKEQGILPDLDAPLVIKHKQKEEQILDIKENPVDG